MISTRLETKTMKLNSVTDSSKEETSNIDIILFEF